MNIIWITFLFNCIIFAHPCVFCVRIEENGYKGITISFSDRALQKSFDFEKLKLVLRNASEVLFHATKNRSYFEEFVFVVPSTWTESYACEGDATQVPESVDVHVTDSAQIRSLSARHSKGCGQKGDVIYMPREWLAGDVQDLAVELVQQWSVFRYGVFPENPETPGSCFASSTSSWHPSGCYTIELDVEPSFDDNGLPVCYFPEDFKENENLLSSIMFSSNYTKVQDYCDGSENFPHNPVAPTLHNRICEGKSVWSVIRNTDDFLYGRNLPVEESKPPTFRCFKESKPHVTLIVQDTDTEARSEIRYALFYFLYNIAKGDFRVSLATFSNDTLTENTDPLELPLKDEDQLKSLLLANLKLNKKVENICLICGLRKAYNISADSHHPLRVVVLLAPASSLSSADMVELVELIRENDGKAVLHLLILQDTGSEDILSSLVDAMQEGRGRISWIRNDRVFMFTQINTALVDASRNILKIEDDVLVVYQETRLNVASDFIDIFMTPENVEGTLLYSIQCKNRGDILSEDGGCSILSQELQSPVCESKLDLKVNEASSNVRKYSFEYMAGSEGSTCVSLALLKLASSSSENVFGMRGWFNEKKITPGRNALIIYAEVLGAEKDVLVEARISGPGLADFRLELWDNGNGDPDIIRGDKIYSRYFTSFTQKGTYIVSIHASALISDGNRTKEKSDDSKRVISQAKVIGSFRVTEDPPKEDIIPPNRVSDLKVVSINSENRTATLEWTAPGDNYDDGRAIQYKVYLTNDWRNVQDVILDKILYRIINASNDPPQICGNYEERILQLPSNSQPVVYFLAVKAVDKSGNEGRLSNIVQLSIVQPDLGKENITTENETKDDTNKVTDCEYLNNEEKKYMYIIAGSASGIIILIILVNILVWIICFKKYKKLHKTTAMNECYNYDTKALQTRENMHSNNDVFRNEYENSLARETSQTGDISHNHNLNSENEGSSNPMLLYAEIQKRNKIQDSATSTQNDQRIKTQQTQMQNQRENDLGFV